MSRLTRTPGTFAFAPLVAPVVTRTRHVRRALACLLGAAALAACAAPAAQDPGYATVHSVGNGAPSAYHGTAIDQPYQLPKATWTDTSGAKVVWPADGLPDPVTVVFFAYTSCPDVCSTQLADITQAIRASDPQLQRKIGLVFVTVDPKRDDAATIRSFLDGFDKTLDQKYVGLRSDDTAMLVKAAESLGVALTGSTDTATGYEVGHGAQLIGFGPDGTAPVIWLPGTPVGDIRADLLSLSQSG